MVDQMTLESPLTATRPARRPAWRAYTR